MLCPQSVHFEFAPGRDTARSTSSFVYGWLFCLAFLFSFSSSACAASQPANFEAIVSEAAAARQQNDLPSAIQLYGEATQLKPDWPEGWWLLGTLQYQVHDYSAARNALTRLLALAPDSAMGLALRGLCEFETGEYDRSLLDIRAGLSQGAGAQPEIDRALRYHQALLLTLSGDFENALHEYAFLAAESASGANPELLRPAGLAALRMQMLPVNVRPNQQDLLMAVGTAALDFLTGKTAEGEQKFQDLNKRYPTTPNLHYLHGYFLFAKEPDRAAAEFRRELQISPGNAVDQVMLAWYLLLHNQFSEALRLSEAAVTEAPSSSGAQLVLGRSLTDTGDAKTGLGHLQTALKLDPDNIEVHLALVHVYSELGSKRAAQQERMQVLQMTQNEAGTVARP